jgi:mannitol-1-phosphate/altronate dehydrogenase
VHLGLGHFHRAHQAVYFDELLSTGKSRAGITGINLVPDALPLEKILPDQDYLYTHISKSAGGEEVVRVVGSMGTYINAAHNRREGIARLAAAETGLITLTVTEKGYCYDEGAEDLAWEHEGIRRDLQNPEQPETTIGFLAAALALRFRAGGQPITILSCDNFPANGRVLQKCVLSFCGEAYPSLLPWLEDAAAFPNSMVDGITPNTTGEIAAYLRDRYGIIDRWPVCSEDYRQWVLEDNFKLPPEPGFDMRDLREVGAQIVGDVEPYELMKIRLLNGGHSALAYPAYLMGYTGVAEAITDPLLQRFIRGCYMEEITATLPPVPGVDPGAYKDTLIRRFSNKNIADTILRLASDGSKKIPNAILRPLEQTVAGGLPRDAMVFALAAWARFLTGVDESGKPIPLEDANGGPVIAAAGKAREEPEGFLRTIGIQGGGEAALTERFSAALEDIYRRGTRKALEALVEG